MSEEGEKLSKRDGQFLSDETETDAQIATYYDAQSVEDMLAEFEEARQAGAVRAGGLDVERNVPVTIRLPVSLMEALKAEVERRRVAITKPCSSSGSGSVSPSSRAKARRRLPQSSSASGHCRALWTTRQTSMTCFASSTW